MNHAETVTAPAFSPYGKTTVDGGTVYRFPASSMRADLPEQAVSVLGQQPEIEAATLPISPGPDRSVRRTLHLRQRVGRVRLGRSYRDTELESGSVSRPAWVVS